jgi:hypothetical protein
VDQTNEPLYQRAMLCWSRLGFHSEVEKIYLRCCDAMGAMFDMAPSQKTTDIYREARISGR